MATSAKWAHDAEASPEAWDSPERGRVVFRTLFGGAETVPDGVTAGVCTIEPGDRLRRHSHHPAEVYYVLQGRCSVVVDGEQRELTPGGSVLIPGDHPHSVANTGAETVRIFYVLAAQSMADVVYSFDAESP